MARGGAFQAELKCERWPGPVEGASMLGEFSVVSKGYVGGEVLPRARDALETDSDEWLWGPFPWL